MSRFQKKRNQLTGDETVDPRYDNFHLTSNPSPGRAKTNLLRENLREKVRRLKPEWLEMSTTKKYGVVIRKSLSIGLSSASLTALNVKIGTVTEASSGLAARMLTLR